MNYSDFRTMVNTVLDQSVGVQNMSGRATQTKCTELAVSIPVHRPWLDHLLSLFPDFLHICGISVNKQVVSYESVKVDSVLSLVRNFLDACAFFDMEKYALAFLTNMLLVLDKANYGAAVCDITDHGFYLQMTGTAFEKAVRRRWWVMMCPKGEGAREIFEGEEENIKKEMESKDPYMRKQVYLGLLEMAKKEDYKERVADFFEKKEDFEKQVLNETDIFAQAAFVRLFPYLYGDESISEGTWDKLAYHAKLSLALECHEGQNDQTELAECVFKYAQEPIKVNGKKFISKRLRALGVTKSATASFDPVRDLTDDTDKPYTERLPPMTIGVTSQDVVDSGEGDDHLKNYMRWLRSPIYLARERAVDTIVELFAGLYIESSTPVDDKVRKKQSDHKKHLRAKFKDIFVAEYEIGDVATRHSLMTLLWRLSRVFVPTQRRDNGRAASILDLLVEPKSQDFQIPLNGIEAMVTRRDSGSGAKVTDRDSGMSPVTSFSNESSTSVYRYWHALECRDCERLCRPITSATKKKKGRK